MASQALTAKNLARYGLSRGAYDGARKRRFVLFVDNRDGTVTRREFDTKADRDAVALAKLQNAIARAEG